VKIANWFRCSPERLGRMRIKSFQISFRSGFMDVELTNDQVLISSQAVIVFEGGIVL
jgi:hypothetical protein